MSKERRTVTMLFCDVKGSTALAEKLDPEDWTQIMEGAFDVLVAAVYRYGGTLARLMGDAILAFFGAPVAHEDDPERACHAALDIIAGAQQYARRLQHERGIEGFSVRVGIHTGLVVVGEVGADSRVEYTAMGDAVNLAAGMESAAEPGTVLITVDTHRLISSLFETKYVGPVSVKGKAEPVAGFRVLAPVATAGKLRGIPGLESPLVGRQAELSVLQGAVQGLQAGRGAIVTVMGEAGLGKSRLIAELCRALGADGPPTVQFLEGRSPPFGERISYWPFREMIRHYAGITEADDEDSAWAKLESRVRALLPEQVSEILPYLASLLALPVRGEYKTRVKYLNAGAMGRQVFLASRRFFEHLAQLQPLVLIFEDMHWIDRSSDALLEHLLTLVETVPILFCGISRSGLGTPAVRLGRVAARDYSARFLNIRLEPLSKAESDQLVRNLLASDVLPSSVQTKILEKAEGNPFFVEEVIRALITTGAIVRDTSSGRWQATAAIEQFTIPDTVQGVIAARVDRLDDDLKRVLRVASVIGRSFLYRVLRDLAAGDRDLEARLAALQRAELIQERQRSPELEYTFRHALTHEATYASILVQERRELHARVGACIERLYGDRLEGFYGLLAYHYARAEQWNKALEYLFKAGDQAGQLAGDAEALTYYRQALEAYTRVFGDRWDPGQRAVVERKMGEALYRRGDHEQARAYLLRAMDHLGYSFPTTRRGVRRAIAQEVLRQVGHRLVRISSASSLRGGADTTVQETMRLIAALGWIESGIDQERLLLCALWAANFAERQGDLLSVATGFYGIGMTCDLLGLQRFAAYYHRRALAAAEQVQDPNALAQAYFGLALHGLCGGDWATALGLFGRAADIYRAMGDLHGWAANVVYPVRMWGLCGDSSGARDRLLESISVCREAGDTQALAFALQGLALVLLHTGPLTEAVEVAEEAIELNRTVPNYVSMAATSGQLGLAYLRMGKLDQAVGMLESTMRLVDTRRVVGTAPTYPRNALATAYLMASEQAAGSEKEAWLKKARRACQAALRQGRVDCTGWLYALRMQARYEWLRGNRRGALRSWQRGLAEAQRLQVPYEIGMFHLEMGERLAERAHLEQAEAILAKVGATLDLARARELSGRKATGPADGERQG